MSNNGENIVKPRDAATLVLLRGGADAPEVLMGVRGSKARFMPSRRVFPGGRLDAADWRVPVLRGLPETSRARLQKETERPGIAVPLALAAIRETFEETGLALGVPETAPLAEEMPEGSWTAFHALGLTPALDHLRFVFRAVTPRDYPMRFDARFFLAPIQAVVGDSGDLSRASGELQDLRWIGIEEALVIGDLPFITGVVLREIQAILVHGQEDRPVPFFSEGRYTELVRKL